jgi:predicted DCC family thiol-disulfide oxidoreductase YuxK
MIVATHLGILLLQRILFFDLILLQLVFVDFISIRRAIGRRIAARHRQIEVIYDGSCALCRRTVRLLGALDLFSALQFEDFRRLNLDAYNQTHRVNLALPDLDEEMHIIARGRVFRGFSAYRVIAMAVPLLWPLVPVMFLPGISSLGRQIYARIASHRASLVRCDDACANEPSIEEAQLSARGAGLVRGARSGYALTLSLIVVVATVCWLRNVEFYPLSAWHLYAMLETSGKVKYLKVLGHYDSGRVSSVRIEDGIGALALDGRYQVPLDKCFGGVADVSVCEQFLVANGSAYNVDKRPGDRLTQYEIQNWTWDFLSSPRDPHYGQLQNRFIVDVPKHGNEKPQAGSRLSDY